MDPEPEKVRSTLSRRDQLWNDDWVGLSLDSVGNGQSSYDLFVNPSGVQADILTTPSAGENTAPYGVRAIVQYDSSRHEVLTDFLASWELLPGTVAYAGYGSIIERRGWDGSVFTDDPTGFYRTSERGFFPEASYIHRF